ncbi:MAG: ABC transporter ATP-binding protein [Planctomycetota bacterium]|jgi:putative ABC transport system ATP-binding protein|nr:ABC transporter ATP-binding protein [Planctomycetota bacterium]
MAVVAELEDVTRIYKMGDTEVRALDGISVKFCSAEYWSIMGSSGSGKSTLLNILGCIDTPTSGAYRVGGKDTKSLNDDSLSDLRGTSIGFIFQSFNLIQQLNVIENIMVPTFYRNHDAAKSVERAEQLAQRVGLEERLLHRPNELSGGQQQRVAIARALMNDPQIILADEATGNLDSQTTEEILELFSELHAEGKTILLVTHELDVGQRAQNILTLKDGKVFSIEEGKG